MSKDWQPLRAEDFEYGEASLMANVGGVQREVDMRSYLEIHTALSNKFRAAGLQGRELDVAIHEELPKALAEAARLDGETTH